jgi:hypothetical protein
VGAENSVRCLSAVFGELDPRRAETVLPRRVRLFGCFTRAREYQIRSNVARGKARQCTCRALNSLRRPALVGDRLARATVSLCGEEPFAASTQRWRSTQAWPACLAEHGQAHPACQPSWPRAEALGAELEAVPASAGRRHASPAISSPSRRSRCGASTCSSSSNSQAAASISRAAPPIRPVRG